MRIKKEGDADWTYIGFTTYGTSLSINDYSRKDRDTYGEITIIQRGYTVSVNYNIEIDQDDTMAVFQALAACRAVKTQYEGHPDRPEINVTGYLNSFSIDIGDFNNVTVTLDVESEIISP